MSLACCARPPAPLHKVYPWQPILGKGLCKTLDVNRGMHTLKLCNSQPLRRIYAALSPLVQHQRHPQRHLRDLAWPERPKGTLLPHGCTHLSMPNLPKLAPSRSKTQQLAPGAPGQRPKRTAAIVSMSSCTGSCTWKLGTMSTSSSSAENSSCAGSKPDILLHTLALECSLKSDC